ncbi:MAG: glutamate synthase subunit beta [Prevotellaceae bacterium]|jgi:glutamate synthase (NADPH/NADH) small chain|nr:glutamate synthase subunit beta [Prevotellaceae bacterium]
MTKLPNWNLSRKEASYRPVHERIADYSEVEQTLNRDDRVLQASRCMDCGVPFCHWACPLGNRMPEWQSLLAKGDWPAAYRLLATTHNFPEFTGRLCPALCEKSCVLNTYAQPVTTRENEAAITEYAFAEGYVKPAPPATRTGKRIAVIGSGPAGLATADMLNRKGHEVTVFEKDERPGGLLRFGIPDFKLGKDLLDRRLNILLQEGIIFQSGVEAGKDLDPAALLNGYDAVCLAVGAGRPRELPVEGRELKGVHLALELLQQQNRVLSALPVNHELISAKGKRVLVIGGGDTGSDCVGVSVRHRAAAVTQIEIMPEPPEHYNPATPWPNYPLVKKTSSSHLEGCMRRWNLSTRRFIGENGQLTGVEVIAVTWEKDAAGRMTMKETGEPEIIPAELVLLSMGFVHPVHEGLLDRLGVAYDARGNVAADAGNQTSVNKLFVAGDAHYGAGLVVRAIASGRQAAANIDRFLAR